MKKLLSIDSDRIDIEQLELKGFARSIAEIEWLLLVLIILYFVTPDATIQNREALVLSMVGFALFVLGFHYLNAEARQRRWKLALETWVMILFITWVIWNTGGPASPLVNLFLLVIITSAITLGKLATLLEILLIGALYFLVASQSGQAYSYAEFSRLMIYFAPFALVAYITTLLVADLHIGRRMFQALAETDALTGLLNKRSLLSLLKRETEAAEAEGSNLNVLVVDVDNLKQVNGEHGHGAGDKLISTVAEAIASNVNVEGMVGRFGGDEFVVVLPEVSARQAMEIAEKIRRAAANTSFDAEGTQVSTTVSIGLASYPAETERAGELFDRADESLYQSKNAGRNRVTLYRRRAAG